MKKILSLAIAAAVAAPMAAMADATMYGKVRVSVDSATVDKAGSDEDTIGLNDRVSRIGIKGSEDLGNGLKGVYKMEQGLSVGDSFKFSGRNAYVGLAGGFGTLLVGRHDTPHKMSTGKLDLFADTAADYNATIGFNDIRADGVIAYVSPSMSGFTLAGAIVSNDDQEDEKYSTGKFLGKVGADATDNLADAYSIAAMYSNGPFFGALAYESILSDLAYLKTPGDNQDDYDKIRVGLGLMGLSGFTVTGVYEQQELGSWDADLFQIQAAYDMGANRFKAMYGQSEDSNDNEGDAFALGYQYSFSKRTNAEVLYTEMEDDAVDNTKDSETEIFSVQVNHAF